MSVRTAFVVAWSTAAASIAMTVTGAARAIAEPGSVSHSSVFFVLVLAVVFATAVVGALVASRQPANPIGWVFCGFSVLRAFSALAAGYAEIAPDGARHGLGQYAAWIFNRSYVPLFAFAVYVLILFPDGRILPGRRWRAAFRCGIAGPIFLVPRAPGSGARFDFELSALRNDPVTASPYKGG